MRSLARLLVFALLALIVAVASLGARTYREDDAGIGPMVRGTAHRPFVYRQLAPQTIRLALAVTPASWWEGLERRIEDAGAVEKLHSWTHADYSWWRNEDSSEIVLGAVLNFLAVLGFAYAFRVLLRDCCQAPESFFDVTVAIGVYFLVFLTREGVYVYDYLELCLYTAALVLLQRGWWVAYYAVFAVGVYNKETGILLAAVFLVTQLNRMPTSRLLAHAAVQAAIFTAIRLWLTATFRSNPGASFEWHLQSHNVAWILKPGTLVEALALLGLAGIILHGWERKPLFLRRAAVVIWPLWGLTLLFGWIDELRDYYAAYPPIVALAAISWAELVFGARITSRVPAGAVR